MEYYVTWVKDILGSNYLGININKDIVDPYLQEMKFYIDNDEEYEEFVTNQQNRDDGNYHITLINVSEYNMLSKRMGMSNFINSLERVFAFPIDDLELVGLGMAQKNVNSAYYIVVNSDRLDSIRTLYDLNKRDFHITLGFKHKDVFGVPKNEILPKSDPFLKLLSKQYYNHHQTFDFIKSFPGYDSDIKSRIEPLKIDKKEAIYRVGKFDIIRLTYQDGEFKIDEPDPVEYKELRNLTHVEVNKILKKNKL